MLTIEMIKRKKAEYGFTNAQLSRLSGVPLGTVQKVLGNITKSPGIETVKALSEVFEKEEKYSNYDFEGKAESFDEPVAAYRVNHPARQWNIHHYDRQGTYTIDDYLALPDEQRVEMIDGVFYDMAAPTPYHQLIGGEIFVTISNFIRKNKGSCIPFMSPVDVQLDCDDKTMVQPDVAIVCDRDMINHTRIVGAPDFVCEVLSPSTKVKDVMIKGAKYHGAGVKEYWIIDPNKKTVMVYDFRNGLEINTYTFEDKIPVLIYDGKLEINMKEIDEYISFAE